MTDQGSDAAYFVVYDATGKIVRTGGATRADLPLQASEPGEYVMEGTEEIHLQMLSWSCRRSSQKPEETPEEAPVAVNLELEKHELIATSDMAMEAIASLSRLAPPISSVDLGSVINDEAVAAPLENAP